jgi:hypothetical protein
MANAQALAKPTFAESDPPSEWHMRHFRIVMSESF